MTQRLALISWAVPREQLRPGERSWGLWVSSGWGGGWEGPGERSAKSILSFRLRESSPVPFHSRPGPPRTADDRVPAEGEAAGCRARPWPAMPGKSWKGMNEQPAPWPPHPPHYSAPSLAVPGCGCANPCYFWGALHFREHIQAIPASDPGAAPRQLFLVSPLGPPPPRIPSPERLGSCH